MKAIRTILLDMTPADIRTWAGVTIFNRGKGYVNKVNHLARTADGELAAWVSGSKEYATSVRVDTHYEFEHFCTCPYEWGVCKHAVALVLAAAEQANRGQDIPLLDEEDDLYLALFQDDDHDAWEEDDDPPAETRPRKEKATGDTRIEAVLEKKSREELLALLIEAAARHPEVKRRIQEKEHLASGKAEKLILSVRKEIRNLTAEPAWADHWSNARCIPDFSHIKEQLSALLENGHADAVLQLGDELFVRGQDQVGQSDDEGDTAAGIAACLDVVMDALPRSTLTPPQQILWTIDRALKDEYSLLDSCEQSLQEGAYDHDHWRDAALALDDRLAKKRKPSSGDYRGRNLYDRLVYWLIYAYRRGGEERKIIPLLEREVDATLRYDQLVKELLEAGDKDRARQWCIQGFMRTGQQSPGIAHALQMRLRGMAETEGSHDLVASYRAQDFFEHACIENYLSLRKAAEKTGCWPRVRTATLHYLETGRRPDLENGDIKAEWPLPPPEVQYPIKGARGHERFPNLPVLIDIAILEKRHDDVIEHYRSLQKSRLWRADTDRAVAQALTKTHPQVALEIWQCIVLGLIKQVKPRAYEEAAAYLEQMRTVYENTRRLDDWHALINRLRAEHKPKRRLMAELDRLEKKKFGGG